MALPILDGNQSATTLSTILSGGEHTPAHTVVSLGSTAISNITSAVSGITIAGTVTANVNLITDQAGGNSPVVFGVSGADVNTIRTVIYSSSNSSFGNDQGAPVDSENPLPISGTVTVNTDGNNPPIVISRISDSNGDDIILDNGNVPISGTVTANVGNSVTVANLPQAEDNGDVIINGLQIGFTDTGSTVFRNVSDSFPLPVSVGNSVTIGSLPAISGTVTVGLADQLYYIGTPVFVAAYVDSPGGSVIPVSQDANAGMPISGTVTVGNSVTIGSLPAISGTVTAAAPNGSLTTRFGSVTTANTAELTSAVTNASRKYLLIQNVTTSSNVITVGIGFTPTTTQGIQLTAGAGITFESSYIPTGAVYVLSSVTASPFTVLEA